MAKVAFTKKDRKAGGFASFDSLEANAEVKVRVYRGLDQSLKFSVHAEDQDGFPASTVAVYVIPAHQNDGGKFVYPTKSVEMLRADMVKDKLVTKGEAERILPGKRGTFYFAKK